MFLAYSVTHDLGYNSLNPLSNHQTYIKNIIVYFPQWKSVLHICKPDFPTISSVQSLSCVQLLATPWTAACQTSLSITNSRSLLKLMSIESVMPSYYLILCHTLLLLPSIFPSIRVRIRWSKYQSFQ